MSDANAELRKAFLAGVQAYADSINHQTPTGSFWETIAEQKYPRPKVEVPIFASIDNYPGYKSLCIWGDRFIGRRYLPDGNSEEYFLTSVSDYRHVKLALQYLGQTMLHSADLQFVQAWLKFKKENNL